MPSNHWIPEVEGFIPWRALSFICYSKHPCQRMASALKGHFLFSSAQAGSLIEVVWLWRCYCLWWRQCLLSAFEYLAAYTYVPSDSHNSLKRSEFFGSLFTYVISKTLSSKKNLQNSKPIQTVFYFNPLCHSKLPAVHATQGIHHLAPHE